MSKRYILIDPVTRVEGEARVVIVVNGKNSIDEIYYEILSTRGFESFCIGRAVEELPRITSTICGVCSWAHHVASGKTLDKLFGREPPITAKKIRELAYYMQIIDSHLLHFGVMALPDLVFPETDPLTRNIIGLLKVEPKIASTILGTRRYIKQIEKIFGGKPIHAAFMIPGGVTRSLKEEDVEKLKEQVGELKKLIIDILDFFKNRIVKSELYQSLLNDESYMLKTYYMGLIGSGRELTFYDGKLKIIDSEGREIAVFNVDDYTEYIAEYMSNWSYSKFPYLRKLGWHGFDEKYILRVGPLARINVVDKVPTEIGGNEYKEMIESLGGKPIHNTMAYHWARIIEIVYSIERMEEMLDDPDLLSKDTVNLEGEPRYEGMGVIEAPRGVLIHHYKSDEHFIATHVNIITPTTFNNAAINTELKKVARKHLDLTNGDRVEYKVLNKLEMSIRAYDPCNSCAAHVIDLSTSDEFKVLIIEKETGRKRLVKYKVV
ncbi:MAG: Ni/Fe hydrogenase subunit alpha [Desulfurococcales archaeon ex4484_58]|nr:MAG: Ni/Fe hydrogenase subunit alpha [Desulfurococcales archaeon ex4484_58]